jgi:hypothetical protein
VSIGPEHRLAVRNETFVSIAINSLVPSAIIWIVGATPPRTLLGPDPLIGSMVPAAGLATFAMTLILTQIVRARVRAGALPGLDWPAQERGLMRYLPNNLLLRAIALGLLALVLLVPSGLIVMALLDVLPMSRVEFLIFNLIYGALVGLVMARFVVLPALADPARAPSAASS